MILRQYLDAMPVVAASYLLGCGGKATGAVIMLPGAFSGSVCGRGLSGKATSIIGFERRFNRGFAIEDEETFVAFMLREIPPRPERASEIRAENLGLAVLPA